MRRTALLALLAATTVAGCGSTASTPADGIPRLDFGYDASAPLHYADRGSERNKQGITIHDVSFESGGRSIDGFLVVPPGPGRRPAVVFVHGSGGDRSQLLGQAAILAARNVVTLTITAPSTFVPSTATTGSALLEQARSTTVNDVVAVRRAVDLLETLPSVDPKRIGYLGWSAGARTGAVVAAAEPRVKALVLLSAGAAPLAAFVSNAPKSLRPEVKRVLGSVDPLRYIAWARPGSILLEDGRRDEVVPHAGLVNIAHAAPKGTGLRWYDTTHVLDSAAYRDAFDWLKKKLA